jgi:hypothetical protein
MSTYVVVTLEIEVDDPAAFAAEACRRADLEGWIEEDIASTFTADALAACAQMIFDPGVSPVGCTITNCEAEVHRGLSV